MQKADPQVTAVDSSVKVSVQAEARFWSKVLKGEGCWAWTAGRFDNGYGSFWWNGRDHGAHRISWMMATGSAIPKEAFICHRCDNAVCVNPAHLYLGDAASNSDDRRIGGRVAKGESQGNAKLTEEQVVGMRNAYAKDHVSQQALAEKFGLATSTVHAIVTHKGWRHIGDPSAELLILLSGIDPLRRRYTGARSPVAKLTEDQAQIAKACPRGHAVRLSGLLGVHHSLIGHIKKGKLWPHIRVTDDARQKCQALLSDRFPGVVPWWVPGGKRPKQQKIVRDKAATPKRAVETLECRDDDNCAGGLVDGAEECGFGYK